MRQLSHRLACESTVSYPLAVETNDPRAVRSREAILAAARSLLAEGGPAAVTHQRVAERAGVGRATVYRHWAQPDHLVYDALTDAPFPFFAELEGPLRPWLREELRRMADEMTIPGVARFAASLVEKAQHHDRTGGRRDGLQDKLTRRVARAFAAAAARGETQPLADPTETVACLLGPLHYRILIQGAPVTDAFLDRLIAAAAPEPATATTS